MESSAPVVELLQHFRDDPKLYPLLTKLDELSGRIRDAEVNNAAEMRSQSGAGAHRAPLGQRPQLLAIKIEDASLPLVPQGDLQPLPSFEGLNDWEVLQGPVSEACSHFSSPTAKVTWKKWALTQANVTVMVVVAWWTLAHVFRPEHPLAAPLQDYAFRFFSTRYAHDVLTWGGASKDLYQDLWLGVIASAVTSLLKAAFPRSSHKLDADLTAFIQAQLHRWTVGTLPADLHPSSHSLLGRVTPAAITHFQRQLQASPAALLKDAPTAGSPLLHESLRMHPNWSTAGPAWLTSRGSTAAGDTPGTRQKSWLATAASATADAAPGVPLSAVASGASPSPTVLAVRQSLRNEAEAALADAVRSAAPGSVRPHRDASSPSHQSRRVSLDKGERELLAAALANASAVGSGNRPAAGADGEAAALGAKVPVRRVPLQATALRAATGARIAPEQQVPLLPLLPLPSQRPTGRRPQTHPAVSQPNPSSGRASPPRHAGSGAPVLAQPADRNSASGRTSPERGSPSRGGLSATSPHIFSLSRTSPALAHLFETHQLGQPAAGEMSQLHSAAHGRLGSRQANLRAPLDSPPTPAMIHASGGGEEQLGGARGSRQRGARRATSVSPERASPSARSHRGVLPGERGGAQGAAEDEGTRAGVGAGDASELSYRSMAKAITQRAAQAVAKYEASKKVARKEVAALRKRSKLLASGPDLPPGTHVKNVSNRLSGWVQNDIDRMLKDQTLATVHIVQPKPKVSSQAALQHGSSEREEEVQLDMASVLAALQGGNSEVLPGRHRLPDNTPGGRTAATDLVLRAGGGASLGANVRDHHVSNGFGVGGMPKYLAMTAAVVQGAGRPSAGFISATAATAQLNSSTTRVMQDWSKMRAVESHIASALNQSRHGTSNDLAARAAANERAEINRNAIPGMYGNGLSGAAWKPSPLEYSRGTLDIRIRQGARQAMRAVDMELYKD